MVVFGRRTVLCMFVTVCGLISLSNYWWDGSVPILGVGPRKPTGGGDYSAVFTREELVGGTIHCWRVDNNTGKRPDALSQAKRPPPTRKPLLSVDLLMEKITSREKLSVGGLKNLDALSLNRYYECQPRKPLQETNQIPECSKLSFQTANHPVVALASFHGSGNTWVRHLLEQVTGFYTGSLYCDKTLKAVFPGEAVISGNVIVVKTHQSNNIKLPFYVNKATGKRIFDKALLIVRDPYDALVSEANRRWSVQGSVDHHVGLAPKTAYRSSKWDWYLELEGMSWSYALHTWLSQTAIPVHVIQYERLLSDLRQELVKAVEFLGYPVNNRTINCAVENSVGQFQRKQHLDFDPFTAEHREFVNRMIRQAAPLLAKHNIKYNTR